MASPVYLQPPESHLSRVSANDSPKTQLNASSERSPTTPQDSSSLAEAGSSTTSENEGKLDRTLPLCNRTDNSDANPESPWSRKVLLALDGGGVRGYSSLLILKRLFFLISQIETGQREGYSVKVAHKDDQTLELYEANQCSQGYPWLVAGDKPMSVHSWAPSVVDEGDDFARISESVEETFSSGVDISHFKPHHYFDYMAGTSTGGLSAIMLSRMEMDIDKAIHQYDWVGTQVFAKPRRLHASIKGANVIRPKYPSRNMEHALQKIINECLKSEMKLHGASPQDVAYARNPERCRTIVIAHGPTDDRNLVNHEYLFRTYDHPYPSPFSTITNNELHRNPGPANFEPIWKVARATSAAPMYFSTMSIGKRKYRDGGMVANNPTELACDEVDQMHEERLQLVISIGTGELGSEASESTSQRYFSYIKDGFNTVKAMKSLLTQCEKTHSRVYRRLHKEGSTYHRFNVDGCMKDIPLDDWKVKKGTNETTKRLRELTMQYLKVPETHKSLLECARLLVRKRRLRAATERWESFATDCVYYCHEKECTSTFKTREGFRNHAYDAHFFVWETRVVGKDPLHWACFWDQCQYGGVFVFNSRKEYVAHLEKEHNIEKGPKFTNRLELEHWLDQGRKKADDTLRMREDVRKRRTMTQEAASRDRHSPTLWNGSESEAASRC